MPTNIFESGATKVAQVDTLAPDAPANGDTYNVTIEDYLGNTDEINLTYTDASPTVAEVIDQVYALMNAAITAAAVPWTGLTITETDTEITVTGVSGEPFTITATSTGDSWTTATPTASRGPNLYNDQGNWSLNAVPVANDDVIIPYYASNDIYGYDDSSVNLTSFTIEDGCPIAIGSSRKYLVIEVKSAGVFTLGGLGLIYLKSTCSDADGSMEIRDAGSGGGDYGFSLNLDGNELDTLTIDASSSAKIGLGVLGSASMAIDESITIKSGNVEIGTVTSAPNLTVYGGSVIVKSALGTVTVHGGIVYDHKGNKTTVDIRSGGIVDCSKTPTARTYTNTSVYSGATHLDPFGTVTYTNGIDFQYCDLSDVTIQHGPHRTWTPSAI